MKDHGGYKLTYIGWCARLIAGYLLIVLTLHPVYGQNPATDGPIKLIILDPGHGHATFMQGSMNPAISPVVHVYAPEGRDVQLYTSSINRMNTRKAGPTSWKIVLYTGEDYLERMISEKKGNTVVISGNNRRKPDYIRRSVEAGFHVLADKPMAVTPDGFQELERSFDTAERNKVLLFDSMDLRYQISNILQKELSLMPDLFGELQKGSEEYPALVQANLHHYLKFSGGRASVRPAWFFDTDEQGHGITDVSTHLVDLNQWLGFPGLSLDYKKDVRILSSREWPTTLRPSEFKAVTQTAGYPGFLKKDVRDSILSVYSNGEINYTIRGVHARVTVLWRYKEPEGSSDTHYSLMRGTKAELEIRQGKEEEYKAALYIRAPKGTDPGSLRNNIQAAELKLQEKYPGTEFVEKGEEWLIKPGRYNRTNAAQTAIMYLQNGTMPEWEVPNMRAKYYTTTQALKEAVLVPDAGL